MKRCAACGGVISAERARQVGPNWVKTCSAPCAKVHWKALRAAAQRRYYAKTKGTRK